MKVLVTGGAGFIGSHLCERLLEDGTHVRTIDNLSTGSMRNIEHLIPNPRFQFIQADILERDPLNAAMEGCDVVFHLAAAVGVKYVIANPLQSIRCNIHGTESVLQAALRHGAAVILASSSEVYGKNADVPFHEESDLVLGATTKPRWSYACGKTMNEFMALAFYREECLQVVIARLFNVCGPRQSACYGMVIPNFVRNALRGLPLEVFGDGSQTRCFAYVGDVVGALCRLARSPAARGGIFNIGSTRETTILGLASRIRELTGSTAPIHHVSYEQAYGSDFEDMSRRVPDITRIRDLLQWQPAIQLDDLLRMIIDDERANLNIG